MLLFILWRDTTSELWTKSNFLYIAIPYTFTRTVYFYLHTITLLPLDTLNPLFTANREIDNLIVSWGKVLGCVVCRFKVATGAKQSPGRGAL
jgi:hypothetical protein